MADTKALREVAQLDLASTPPVRWMTVAGAARYSGLASITIKRAIAARVFTTSLAKLPGHERGRRLIDRASFDAWIERDLVPAEGRA